MPSVTLLEVKVGDYLVRDKRLVEVRSVRKNGDLVVLDAAVPLGGEDDALPHFTVKAREVATGAWVRLQDRVASGGA